MKKSKFEIGEKVVFKKGYSSFHNDSNYGGGGYVDTDIILIVKSVSKFYKGYAYFFEDWVNGVYEYAIDSVLVKRDKLIDEILTNE